MRIALATLVTLVMACGTGTWARSPLDGSIRIPAEPLLQCTTVEGTMGCTMSSEVMEENGRILPRDLDNRLDSGHPFMAVSHGRYGKTTRIYVFFSSKASAPGQPIVDVSSFGYLELSDFSQSHDPRELLKSRGVRMASDGSDRPMGMVEMTREWAYDRTIGVAGSMATSAAIWAIDGSLGALARASSGPTKMLLRAGRVALILIP